jgi:uncharacterized protein (TIGR02145 family)
MKKYCKNSIKFVFLFIVILIFNSCEKEKPKQVPAITTGTVYNITANSAISGGNITNDGGASVVSRGLVWRIYPLSPTIEENDGFTAEGTGLGVFTSTMNGLSANTKYYVRAYATNEKGKGYGDQLSFSTSGPPSVTTIDASLIANCKATLNGTINANGSSTNVKFEYGITSSYGSSVEYTQNPVSGSTDANVSQEITGLVSGQTYYFRIVATNTYGQTNGNGLTFKTTVKDGDGNDYNTVTIGTQTWISENLKTTKYNDGNSIPSVTDNTAWVNLTTPGYCWYNNMPDYKNTTYGALYNWYTVNTGKLCPTGWHVSSYPEWTTLSTYLGGTSIAGGKLKETGTTHWKSPNTGATNESGFNAVGGGCRLPSDGTFLVVTEWTYWWTTTETGAPSTGVQTPIVSYNSSNLNSGDAGKPRGQSVRCIRN